MWNIKQTTFEDGSSQIMISEYAFRTDERKKKEKNKDEETTKQNDLKYDNESYKKDKENNKKDNVLSGKDKDKGRSKNESIRRSRQKVEIIGRANRWDYFITLTFDPEKVDSYTFSKVTEFVEKWLDRMRKRFPNMKSLLVFEKHKSGRWHAHGLVAGCNLKLIDSGHKTKKTHDIIYNMPDDFEFGFTTVTHVRSSAAAGRYISKYIGKAMGEVPDNSKRYWASRNCVTDKDCTVKKYLFDKAKERIKEILSEISYRITKSYISEIDNTVIYYHLQSYLDIEDLIEMVSFET